MTSKRCSLTKTRFRLGYDPQISPDDEISASLETLREPGFVTSFLYFFKPPFPSDGGCAAASAGRSGPSAPSSASCRGRNARAFQALAPVHARMARLSSEIPHDLRNANGLTYL